MDSKMEPSKLQAGALTTYTKPLPDIMHAYRRYFINGQSMIQYILSGKQAVQKWSVKRTQSSHISLLDVFPFIKVGTYSMYFHLLTSCRCSEY